jgi:large subunit ribosomal protein L17
MPRVFNELRARYQNREGGYTRVTRTDNVNTYDQAEYAILEFVDGPRDSRFMMTAMAVARDRLQGRESCALTMHNVKKVTRYRGDPNVPESGMQEFEAMVARMMRKYKEDLEKTVVPLHTTRKG